jgi:hypothetical protein
MVRGNLGSIQTPDVKVQQPIRSALLKVLSSSLLCLCMLSMLDAFLLTCVHCCIPLLFRLCMPTPIPRWCWVLGHVLTLTCKELHKRTKPSWPADFCTHAACAASNHRHVLHSECLACRFCVNVCCCALSVRMSRLTLTLHARGQHPEGPRGACECFKTLVSSKPER